MTGLQNYLRGHKQFISGEKSELIERAKGIKNSEYDQEIPQLQTADNPKAPRGKAWIEGRNE